MQPLNFQGVKLQQSGIGPNESSVKSGNIISQSMRLRLKFRVQTTRNTSLSVVLPKLPESILWQRNPEDFPCFQTVKVFRRAVISPN